MEKPSKNAIYRKRYYEKNKKDIIRKSMEYNKTPKGREIGRIFQKEHRIKTRNATIEALGARCVKCGFEDRRALQIDHVNGDGHIERTTGKGFGNSYNKRVLQSFLKGENKYQLLCANCNWIKKHENNEK